MRGFTPAASIADRIRARAASPCTGEGFDHGVLVIAEAEGLHTNEPMTALLRGELHTARGRTPMHPGPSAAP
ncbi:hypothetical protein ACFV1F_45630 [Streptomyces sp. NPDC059590]|uniref:hypothetical protein n=1 Tax=Streptomyces sp. NPDC059590 TaxID=3346877 RepID=UPI0036A9C9CE